MAAQMAQQLSAAEADSAAAAAEAATSHSTAVAVLESASASALDALAAAQEKLAAAESAAEEATRNASKEEVEELDFFEDFDNDQDRLSGKGVNNKFKKLAKLIRPVGLVSKGR